MYYKAGKGRCNLQPLPRPDIVTRSRPLTVADDGQDGQVHLSFPVGALLQSDAVAGGGKDVPERTQAHTRRRTNKTKQLTATLFILAPQSGRTLLFPFHFN